jgi:hypothetical protein
VSRRTKYRHLLGSIVPDHQGGGYGIAEAIIIEAARIKKTPPLKLLALSADVATAVSNDRIGGLKRAIDVMRDLLGPGSVDLVMIANHDRIEKTAETWMPAFVPTGPRIHAVGCR